MHFKQAVEENAGYYHLPRPKTMAILQIAIVFIGSALVISGWCIWLGAGALAVFVLLASYIGHAFWKKQGRERDIQLFVFLNHFVIACALLFVAWENVRGAI
jgi:transmembrane protein